MTYSLVLDFVGMAVVIDSPGQLFVGWLAEPGHVHTINYFRADGSPAISSLDLKCAGLTSVDGGAAKTTLKANGRLLDVAGLGIKAPLEPLMQSEFSTVFSLSGGTLEALPAHIGDDLSTWDTPSRGPFHLTDRMRFTGSVPNSTHQIGSIELAARGTEIYGVISSIDRDYGTRGADIRKGFPLTEFALFYRLTNEYGEIPVAAPRGHGANPDSGLCPVGFLTI